MSRLYASIDADASKTQATRRGHNRITTHTRGWDNGVEVRAFSEGNGNDVFHVYQTGGSNGSKTPKLLAIIHGDGRVTLPIDVQYPIDRAKAQEGFTS